MDAIGQPQRLLAIWPADQARLIDTWDGLGLRGTGSGDFEISDLFVPDEQVNPGFYGPPAYDRALFRIKEMPEVGHGAHALGIASAALEAFTGAVNARPAQGSARQAAMGHQQAHQIAFARADALVRAARALLHDTVRAAYEDAGTHPELSLELRVRLREANIFAVRAAKEAVGLVFDMAGSGAVYRGRPIEQAFRDISTAANHTNYLETAYTAIGSYYLTRDREAGPRYRRTAVLLECRVTGVPSYWPTRPSIRSRSRSACPRCRAYSSTMCTITSRSATVDPSFIGRRTSRSGESSTYCWAKATSSRQARHASATTAGSGTAPAQSASATSFRPVPRRRVRLGHHPPEPVALHVGHVPDQAEQRHSGRRYRAAGKLLRVEAVALHLQRQPVGAQVVEQRRPLPGQLAGHREPRVLRGVHPHVGRRPDRVPALGQRVFWALTGHGPSLSSTPPARPNRVP